MFTWPRCSTCGSAGLSAPAILAAVNAGTLSLDFLDAFDPKEQR